jgi:hypothetical protein
LVLAKHCSGGVILGFEQFYCRQGVSKRGTSKQKTVRSATVFPTAWNNLEAGILFGLHLPLLVFKEDGIYDGVFDAGVTDVFLYPIPKPAMKPRERQALREVSTNGKQTFAGTTMVSEKIVLNRAARYA